MARKKTSLGFKGLKGSGIVPVLFIIGFLIYKFTNLRTLGEFAMFVAVIVGIFYALLGVIGILKKL